MSFSDNLKRIRNEKKITLKELGEKLGCSPQSIAQYESGKRNPKIETLQKIADALEVPLVELFVIDDDKLGKVVDLTELDTTEQVKLSLLKLLTDKSLDFQNDKTGEIKHFQLSVFYDYLESIGYKLLIDTEGQLEDKYYIGIQDNEHDNVIFFSKKEFKEFENEIRKIIEYKIYKQNNKN